MGWSGWDMPKEHWLRKNNKAFSRRKDRLDFKLRTQVGTSNNNQHQAPQSNVSNRLKRKLEWSKKTRYLQYALAIFMLGFVIFIGQAIKNDFQGFSASEDRITVTPYVGRDYVRGHEKDKAIEVLIEGGYRSLDLKEYEDAVDEFERALRLFPENKEAMRGLVWGKTLNCESTRYDCEEAIDLLRIYLKENSDLDLLGHQKIIEGYLEK